MKRLIIGILLLISIICSGQFDCPDGALISSIPIDSITITDGLLTHYEGTSTDKSRFKRGIILNGVPIDSISNSSGWWTWYKGSSNSGKFNASLGIKIGSLYTIDSVYVNGNDIDSVYISGIGYPATNMGYYYTTGGWNIGQELWTLTDIELDEDSLTFEINDTAYYRLIGDSSLVFVDKQLANAPDTVINAPYGISVFDNTTKTQSITEDTDSLIWNVGGWKFKIEQSADPYGPELVTDGGFDDPGEWNCIGSCAVTGSKLVFTAADGSDYAYQVCGLVNGKTYHVEFDVSGFSGTGIMVSAAGGYDDIHADGSYSFDLTCTGVGGDISFTGQGPATTCNIDNVTVREVL